MKAREIEAFRKAMIGFSIEALQIIAVVHEQTYTTHIRAAKKAQSEANESKVRQRLVEKEIRKRLDGRSNASKSVSRG